MNFLDLWIFAPKVWYCSNYNITNNRSISNFRWKSDLLIEWFINFKFSRKNMGLPILRSYTSAVASKFGHVRMMYEIFNFNAFSLQICGTSFWIPMKTAIWCELCTECSIWCHKRRLFTFWIADWAIYQGTHYTSNPGNLRENLKCISHYIRKSDFHRKFEIDRLFVIL